MSASKPRRSKASEFMGFPLWFCLRRVATYKDSSRIGALLGGSIVFLAGATKCDVGAEFLYRVVRRYPGKILACDHETKHRIESKTNCSLRNRWPYGLGLLTASNGPFGRRALSATSEICHADPEWQGLGSASLERSRAMDKKAFQKMSTDEKRAAILIAELKGYLHAAPWIRREKDRRAKEFAGTRRAARTDHVGNDQQRG